MVLGAHQGIGPRCYRDNPFRCHGHPPVWTHRASREALDEAHDILPNPGAPVTPQKSPKTSMTAAARYSPNGFPANISCYSMSSSTCGIFVTSFIASDLLPPGQLWTTWNGWPVVMDTSWAWSATEVPYIPRIALRKHWHQRLQPFHAIHCSAFRWTVPLKHMSKVAFHFACVLCT